MTAGGSLSQAAQPSADPPRPGLPNNVKVLGGGSLLNDVASEMIAPLLPAFLIGVLGGCPCPPLKINRAGMEETS
jgi:hypothetical protein